MRLSCWPTHPQYFQWELSWTFTNGIGYGTTHLAVVGKAIEKSKEADDTGASPTEQPSQPATSSDCEAIAEQTRKEGEPPKPATTGSVPTLKGAREGTTGAGAREGPGSAGAVRVPEIRPKKRKHWQNSRRRKQQGNRRRKRFPASHVPTIYSLTSHGTLIVKCANVQSPTRLTANPRQRKHQTHCQRQQDTSRC